MRSHSSKPAQRVLHALASDWRWGLFAGRIPARLALNGLAVSVGQVLIVADSLLILATAPLLGMPVLAWRVLAAVIIVKVGLVVAAAQLPWVSWPSWAPILFPFAGFGSLLALGLSADRISLAYVGVIPLWFIYSGIFLPLWAGLVQLPIALAAYVAMYGSIPPFGAVRLAIYSVAWIAVSSCLWFFSTRQRDLADSLRNQTRTDALTTLGNRRGLQARLSDLGPGDCMAICDLDLFKSINDAFGHAAGDEVLAQFGMLIDQQLRRRDYAARYGGEEFVLLLMRTDPQQAAAALASLRDEWLDLGEGVTFSAGIAQVTDLRSAALTLEAADAALYEAKAAGRDQFFCAPSTAGLTTAHE